MQRQNISSGSPYEKPFGFSRAVRVGNLISVAGTAPIADHGTTANPGDIYKQAKRCIEIMEKAIHDAGGRLEDVMRTRIYFTDKSKWQEAARAHGEYFAEILPASTFVEVKALIKEDWLVEMKADCYME